VCKIRYTGLPATQSVDEESERQTTPAASTSIFALVSKSTICTLLRFPIAILELPGAESPHTHTTPLMTIFCNVPPPSRDNRERDVSVESKKSASQEGTGTILERGKESERVETIRDSESRFVIERVVEVAVYKSGPHNADAITASFGLVDRRGS
jgi:hypothetical protein